MRRGTTPRQQSNKRRQMIIPGWLWGGLITGAILIVLFAFNSVAFGLSTLTGGATLICYPIQLGAYFVNGIVSGSFEKRRFQNNRRLNPRTPAPNYIVVGALGGVVVAVIAAIVYIVVTTASVSLIPPAAGLMGPVLPVLIGIDAIAAIGLGAIGGFFYGRFLN